MRQNPLQGWTPIWCLWFPRGLYSTSVKVVARKTHYGLNIWSSLLLERMCTPHRMWWTL